MWWSQLCPGLEFTSCPPSPLAPRPRGLPPGSKPPPLTMLSSPGGAGLKSARTTATVPPLSQVSPSNGLSSSAALNATRTSSFAAALRKLACQAKDPEEVPAKHSGSPGSNLSPSSDRATPKRAPPPLVYSSSHASSLTSPPVVTIAPTQVHPNMITTEPAQSIDRVPSAHSTASSATFDPITLKQERESRPHSSHSREDDRASNKDGHPSGAAAARIMPPHSSPVVVPSVSGSRSEAALGRGFQPYRTGEAELRHSLAAASALGLDPAAYAAFHPAFLQAPYAHPAYRIENDPLLLERYRLLQQPPYLPYPTTVAGMMPHPGLHPLMAGGRYPPELLHQYPYLAASQALDPRSPAALSAADRSRDGERQREMDREREREKEREKEKEQKEKERESELQRQKEHQKEMERKRSTDRREHSSGRHSTENSRGEDAGSKYGAAMSHGSGREGMYGDKSRSGGYSATDLSYKRHEDSRWPENSRSPARAAELDQNNHFHKRSSLSRQVMESSRHSGPSAADLHQRYRGDQHRMEAEQSRGGPPPLLSPRSAASASQGDVSRSKASEPSLFRPFEKSGGGQAAPSYGRHYPEALGLTTSKSSAEVSTVLPMQLVHRDRESERDSREGRAEGGPPSLYPSGGIPLVSQQSRTPKKDSSKSSGLVLSGMTSGGIVTGSGLNHHPERFDFKSLAADFDARADKVLTSHGAVDGHAPPAPPPPPPPPPPPTLHVPQPPGSLGMVDLCSSPDLPLSKLDIEEQKLREARLNGVYRSDSEDEGMGAMEEEEERRREKLMFIGECPTMPLDASPPKMKLMKAIGLTTQRRKRDLQFEKQRRRRRQLRERSVSPAEVVEEGGAPPLSSLPLLDPDSLCRQPDYLHRCHFLASLGLAAVSPEQRQDLEMVRQEVQRDRDRRQRRLQNKASDDAEDGGERESEVGGVKRKHEEMEMEGVRAEPVRITLGQLQQRLEARRSGVAPGNQVYSQARSRQGPSHHRHAVIFPESQDRERQLSREFAEQFHESVLQTTRQRELASRLEEGRGGETGGREGLRLLPGEQSRGWEAGRQGSWKWPGIDGVLEAYQRHQEEQRLERQVLLERCRRLQADNIDLKRTAEGLSRKMEGMLGAKKAMETERSQSQAALEKLTACFKALR